MKKYIIAVHAQKQVGKTTFAKCIRRRYGNFVRIFSFADRVREVANVLGFPSDAIHDGSLKETYIHPSLGVSYRTFAQKFAGDFIRHKFNENFWVQLLLDDLDNMYSKYEDPNSQGIAVIDDMRYENELFFIKNHQYAFDCEVIPLKIKREEFTIMDNHASERGIDDEHFARVIHNHGDWRQYQNAIETFCSVLEAKFPDVVTMQEEYQAD